VAACIIAWVVAALGLLGAVATLVFSLQVGGGATGYVFGLLLVPLLIIAGVAIFSVFTWQGKGWARIVLTVFLAIQVILGLASIGNGSPQSIVGVLLCVLVVVLLWLPLSNAWFKAQKTSA